MAAPESAPRVGLTAPQESKRDFWGRVVGEDDSYAYRRHKGAPCGDAAGSTKFKKDRHRKYLGKYYFIEPNDETNPLGNFTEKRHPIEDAVRDSDCADAYYEFLEGLQQINQQEYLQHGYIGKKYKNERSGLMYDIKSAFGFLGLDKEEEHLNKLATWEREIRTRSNAFQTQLFKNELRERARMGLATKPVHDPHNDRMPIRKETAELLTRPVEQDWTLVGALTYIVNIAIAVISLYSHIRILVLVCPVAFMCPQDTATAGKPILAPPIAFRASNTTGTAVGFRSYVDTYRPWSAKLEQTCTSRSDNACLDGGYLIQWPYVQTQTGMPGTFPEELRKYADGNERCEPHRGGTKGWVYNLYTQSLKREYWECDANDEEYIPFVAAYDGGPGNGGGDTEFTFAVELYEDLHDRTISCMNDALAKFEDDLTNSSVTLSIENWDSVVLNGNMASEIMTFMRTCMTDSPLADSGRCNCGLNDWENFAIGLFYESETTSECSESGFWCKPEIQEAYSRLQARLEDGVRLTPAEEEQLQAYRNQPDAFLCPETETCEPAYKEEQPINTAHKYGCWFTSEAATSSLPADYNSCTGATPYGSTAKYQGMTPQQRMKQETLDMLISKRTVLIIFFLIKEGTIFTAIVLQLIIFLVAFSVLVAIYFAILLPLKLMGSKNLVVTINATMVSLKDAVVGIMDLVGNLCLSLSTVYRTLIKARQVMMGLVNPSIRDMNDKITAVANTVFSLAVLLTLENAEESGIVASMVLTLCQLIFQMTLEKLKLRNMKRPLQDLNENRLSKFETALLWVKIMEEFLSDDVQYNWVQIFNSRAPLKPYEISYPDTLQPEDPQKFVEDSDYKFELSRITKNKTLLGPIKAAFREAYQAMVNVDEEKITYQTMTLTMDPEQAVIFGTDGLRELPETKPGMCGGEQPWHNKKPKQSVVYEPLPGDDPEYLRKVVAGMNAKHCRVKFDPRLGDGRETEKKLVEGTFYEGAIADAPFTAIAPSIEGNKTLTDVGGTPEDAHFDWDQEMWEFQPKRFEYPDQTGASRLTSPTNRGKTPTAASGKPGVSPGAAASSGPFLPPAPPAPFSAPAPPVPYNNGGLAEAASELAGPMASQVPTQASLVNQLPPVSAAAPPMAFPESGEQVAAMAIPEPGQQAPASLAEGMQGVSVSDVNFETAAHSEASRDNQL